MHPPEAHVRTLNRGNLPTASPTTPLLPAPPARPAALPYLPTTENIQLDQYIRNKFSATVFNNLPSFPAFSFPAAKIHLKENAIVVARHIPITIPHH